MVNGPWCRFNWNKIAERLQLGLQSVTLPTTSICPKCRSGPFVTYYDTTTKGAWHHCAKCQLAGDTVEVLSLAGYNPVGEWLLKEGCINEPIPEIELTCRNLHLSNVNAMRNAWRSAGSLMDASRDLTLAIGSVNTIRYDWLQSGHHLVRATSAESLTEAGLTVLLPKDVDTGNVAIMPICQLPGKIVSFSLACLHKGGRLTGGKATLTGLSPSGVFGFNDSVQADTRPVLVCKNPLLAAVVQICALSQVKQTVPIIAAEDYDATIKLMDITSRRRQLILWHPKIDTWVWQCAKQLQAKLLTDTHHDPSVMRDHIRRHTKADIWFMSAISAAKPWDILLKDCIKRDGLDKWLSVVTATDAASVVGDDAINKPRKNLFTVGDAKVVEVNGEWRNAKTNAIISDVLIKLDRVIARAGGKDLWYVGEFSYKNQTQQFCLTERDFSTRLFTVAKRQFVEAEIGLPIIDGNWIRRGGSLAVASAHHVPTEKLDGCGWSHLRQAFVFSQFYIRRDGAIVANNCPMLEREAPRDLLLPTPVTQQQLDALQSDRCRTAVWSLTTAILYNLLADFYSAPKRPILITLADIAENSNIHHLMEMAGCVPVGKKLPNERWPAYGFADSADKALLGVGDIKIATRLYASAEAITTEHTRCQATSVSLSRIQSFEIIRQLIPELLSTFMQKPQPVCDGNLAEIIIELVADFLSSKSACRYETARRPLFWYTRRNDNRLLDCLSLARGLLLVRDSGVAFNRSTNRVSINIKEAVATCKKLKLAVPEFDTLRRGLMEIAGATAIGTQTCSLPADLFTASIEQRTKTKIKIAR